MRARQARRVLHADSLFDAALGAVLLLAGWEGLYRALDLPPVNPAIFAEIGGVVLLGFAYLLWIAPDYSGLARRVAATAAAVNAGAGGLVLLWAAANPPGLEGVGTVLMLLVGGALLVFAALEARIASGG